MYLKEEIRMLQYLLISITYRAICVKLIIKKKAFDIIIDLSA
jgi:hypothetical protein